MRSSQKPGPRWVTKRFPGWELGQIHDGLPAVGRQRCWLAGVQHLPLPHGSKAARDAPERLGRVLPNSQITAWGGGGGGAANDQPRLYPLSLPPGSCSLSLSGLILPGGKLPQEKGFCSLPSKHGRETSPTTLHLKMTPMQSCSFW